MKWLSNILANLRFRNKLILTYISIALVPFLAFASVSGAIFLSNLKATTLDHMGQLIGQAGNSIDIYISGLEETVDYAVIAVRSCYGPDMSETDWQTARQKIETVLKGISDSHPEVAGLFVAFADDRYATTDMTRISRDPFAGEGWYAAACANNGRLTLISNVTGRNIAADKEYSSEGVFSLAKAIVDPKTGGKIGVVLMDVRHELIRESINSVVIGELGFVYVLDSDGNVVYAPGNDVIYRINTRWLMENGARPVTANVRGITYYIRYEISRYTGWKTVGVFSVNELMSGINTVYYVLLCFIGITLALIIFVSIRIAGSVTKPLNKLRSLMRDAESGDLSVRFNSRYNDEIGDLGLSFNHMLDRVEQLIDTVREGERLKRQAELRSLQEQIKPHFLYNTLDTIAWMARKSKANDIVMMIEAMTNMFRIGLSRGKDIIPLGEEITHVTNYMYIQGIRYKATLKTVIKIDQSLYSCRVPKLILQPLAENAIYHGIKPKLQPGAIEITGGLSGDGHNLWLCVRDDGVGMSPERAAAINGSLGGDAEKAGGGFGLSYIQRRLRLSYGPGYGLTISSEEGKGTSATVTIPYN